MSAREQALPAALEEAVQGMAGRVWIDPGAEAFVLDRLRAAWPSVRRELLAEAQPAAAEPAEQGEPAGWAERRKPPTSDAKSDLIRIAADLVRMEAPLPSNPEDHHQKTYSAGVVARAMERHEDALKELAVRVRRVFDKLPPAQPAASGEPAEGYREELVKHCIDAGLPESYASGSPAATARKIAELDRALSEEIDERDRNAEWADKLAFAIEGLTGVEVGEHSSANNPWRVALEAAEAPLPADWREAVEDVVSREMPCTPQCSEVRSATGRKHLSSCPAGDVDHLVLALCSALAPLVLGERLRAERLRRALEDLYEEDDPKTRRRLFEEALAADPPDEALAELLGLPGEFESCSTHSESSEHDRGHVEAQKACAEWLRAVLAKLGLPAEEEAGDG